MMLAALLVLRSTAMPLPVSAEVIIPQSDTEIIEILPSVPWDRGRDRLLRRQVQQSPRDVSALLALGTRYLEAARESGDPRFAGQALASVAAWSSDASAPDAVLLLKANVQQYLHEFDAAAATLHLLLQRPPSTLQPQAWLTLATLRRVQGRYAESTAACDNLAQSGADLYARACRAENAGLTGAVAMARRQFLQLLTNNRLDVSTRAWLLTSLAELEQRAANRQAADVAFRSALRLAPDLYTRLSYADFLIEQSRPREALGVLQFAPRNDAVLLRIAIAGLRAKNATAQRDIAELRQRIAASNLRPESKLIHGREQAMFALLIEGNAPHALELAWGNVTRQREPLDILLLAQATRAQGLRADLLAVKRLVKEIGLVDQRTNNLL